MERKTILTDLFGAKPKVKKINSKKKGDKNELVCAALLLRWTGKHFSRIPRSGGLRWKEKNANICGDLVCQDMEYNFLFAVETKHLKEIFIPAVMRKKSKVLTIWEQAKKDAIRAGKHPIAFLRYNGMPEGTYLVFVENWLAKFFIKCGLEVVSASPTISGFHSEDVLSIPYEDVCSFVNIKVTLTRRE